MSPRIYAYLRASTKDQDATRAEQYLKDFAQQHDFNITAFFFENESGTKLLERKELFRIFDIACPNDIILIERVDR